MKSRAIRKLLLIANLIFGCITSAHSASFDCQKARSINEHLICNDAELSQLDNQLAKNYKDALQGSVISKDLIFNQREAWRRREKECASKPCLIDWFAQRISYFGISQPNQLIANNNYLFIIKNKIKPESKNIGTSRENSTSDVFPANVKKTWTYKPFSIVSKQHGKKMSDFYIANTLMCRSPAVTLQATADLFQNYDLIDSSKTDGTLTVTSFRGTQEGKLVTVSLAVDEQSTPRLVRYILVNGMPALNCN